MAAVAMDAEFGLRAHQASERAWEDSWEDFEAWAEELSPTQYLEDLQAWLESTKHAFGEVIVRYSAAPYPGERAQVKFDAEANFKRWHYANCYPGVKP